MAVKLTYEIVLDDEHPESQFLRESMLLRKMANLVESGQGSVSVGSSQGYNYECIKLVKKEKV